MTPFLSVAGPVNAEDAMFHRLVILLTVTGASALVDVPRNIGSVARSSHSCALPSACNDLKRLRGGGFGFHYSKLPGKGPFTCFCAFIMDCYEAPFPGLVLPTTPWIGGYAASPILYWLFAYGPLSTWFGAQELLQPWGPFELISDADWAARVRLGLACMYVSHFVRRLLECLFLQLYTGKTRRLSDVELSYYFVWGCLCGFSGSATMMSKFGAVTPPVFAAGAATFVFGQAANAYCHYLLTRIKDESQSRHVIPYKFPFNWFVMPHYTAEIVIWTGFCVCSGLNTASITIWALSLCVLQIYAHARRVQYIKMHEEGKIPRGQDPQAYVPGRRWGVLPGLEKL